MPTGLRTGLTAVAGALGGAAAYTLGTQMVAGAIRVGVIKRGPARPMVALTFDDGPDPEHTPRLLEALARAGIRAAFFMVGRQAEALPGVARAVADAGHDLGNHTYGHRHLWTLPPRAAAEEVERGAAAIAEVTGIFPRYFRPPWGMFNWAAYIRAGQLGEMRILWSVRPEGWLSPVNAGEMAARVIRWAHPGAIIDLHDRGGHPTTPRATWTALPGMIAGLRARGYAVVPLSSLLRPAAEDNARCG
ncbi:MAG TPA: polysaccharide deacetylase family protein [bacterium]|nr:polysaccharide deacetylase family protein [bacterium]